VGGIRAYDVGLVVHHGWNSARVSTSLPSARMRWRAVIGSRVWLSLFLHDLSTVFPSLLPMLLFFMRGAEPGTRAPVSHTHGLQLEIS